jgi:hypothetical protein
MLFFNPFNLGDQLLYDFIAFNLTIVGCIIIRYTTSIIHHTIKLFFTTGLGYFFTNPIILRVINTFVPVCIVYLVMTYIREGVYAMTALSTLTAVEYVNVAADRRITDLQVDYKIDKVFKAQYQVPTKEELALPESEINYPKVGIVGVTSIIIITVMLHLVEPTIFNTVAVIVPMTASFASNIFDPSLSKFNEDSLWEYFQRAQILGDDPKLLEMSVKEFRDAGLYVLNSNTCNGFLIRIKVRAFNSAYNFGVLVPEEQSLR